MIGTGSVRFRQRRHSGIDAIPAVLIVLFLPALTSGCATAGDPQDLDPEPQRPVFLGLPSIDPDADSTGVRKELRDLIMGGFRTFQGMTGAVTACLQGQDCAAWNSYAAGLAGMAGRAPEDNYVQGQAVYSLVRGDRGELALIVLEECQASEWWCRALEGFALAEMGRVGEAEAAFSQALALLQGEDLCYWTDASPLVSGDVWSALQGSSCQDRLERLEEFWWLADPAWGVPGNDRKVGHYNRMAWAALHNQALMNPSRTVHYNFGEAHTPAHHDWVIRHGMDLYRYDARWGKLCDWPMGLGGCLACTQAEAARGFTDRGGNPPTPCCPSVEWPWPYCPYTPDAQTYRVIPEETAFLDPFHATAEDWPLDPEGDPESYVPQYGTMVQMDAQVAFFERGSSLMATAAAEVPDDPIFRAASNPVGLLFLQTGPADPPLTAEAKVTDGRWLFQETAPLRRYLVGIESVVPEGLARFRSGHGLPHDPLAPLRLSDLLLFTPEDSMVADFTPADSSLPDSLEAALPLMKGGHRWSRGDVVGVFLEVYGNREAATFPVSVELEQERGGLARIGEILGLTGGKPVNVQWVETAEGGRFALSFTVALGEIDPGNYTLRVSVTGPGMSPAVVEQEIRVRGTEGRSLYDPTVWR
jgi:hypothetical protein